MARAAVGFRLFIADGGHLDQIARLNAFRQAHPEVEITKEDRYWRARWTQPLGRPKTAYAAELEWLLDMLDNHFEVPS